MNIPQLHIQTTRGILGLQIDKPIQEIEQPSATIQLEQPAAILEMSTTKPILSLDTSAVREDVDLKSILRRIDEYAQIGKQGALEGTARRVQEGQQLAQIENGGNTIAEIAKQNTSPSPAPLAIRFVADRTKIQMSFQQGALNMNVTPQKPTLDVQINKPIHNYTPGKVSGSMEQYPSIQIDVQM